MHINELIEAAKGTVQEGLGLPMDIQSFPCTIKRHGAADWFVFCAQHRISPYIHGAFVAEERKVHLLADSVALVPNVFHYLFGHGLFYEQSELGNSLRGEGEPREPSYGYCKAPRGDLEGFSLWIEKLLSKSLGHHYVWALNHQCLPRAEQDLLEYFDAMEQRDTRYGFLSQLGFSPARDDENLIGFLRNHFREGFDSLQFILEYGPSGRGQRTHLLALTDDHSNSMEYAGSWYHITECNEMHLSKLVGLLDILVTDALFSGRLVHGSNQALQSYRTRAVRQMVTQEAIDHNANLAKALQCPDSMSDEYNQMYSEAYMQNALALQERRRPLTLTALLAD